MEFIETMYMKNGKILNLEYHLKRMEKVAKHFKWKMEKLARHTQSVCLGGKSKINKLKIENGEWRVRVIYNQWGIKNIEIFPIKKRKFKTFKIIDVNNFDYKFKYKNRKFFILHFSLYTQFDEFILIKNNLVTDTTISNLAFWNKKEWLTPKYPLLKGTKRQELIDKNFLKEANIHISDLKYFKKMAMINAILGFMEIENFDIIV